MKKLILLIIPLALLFVISFNNRTEFWKDKYDPDYCYLLNGLNLANVYGNIGHFDHPGTTVQVLSAVIIKTTYAFRKTQNDLATDVLLFPEYYLRVIAWIFTITNCLLIFFSGLVIFTLSKEITYGLLFQSISLLSTSINNAFYGVKPEPVLFAAIIILMLVFIRKYFYHKSFGCLKIKYKANPYDLEVVVIILAVVMGFCLATKINSFPLIILPLFFIEKLRNKIGFLIVTVFSFILFTLPIARHYFSFYYWLKNLFYHSGYYGVGNEEIVDFNTVFENFITLLKFEPIIFFVIAITVFFIIKQLIQKKHDIHLKFLIVLCLVQILDLLMVLKHFRLHYFIPIIPTIAINIFIIFQIIGLSKKQKGLLIGSFIIICFVVNINRMLITPSKFSTIIEKEGVNIYAYGCNSLIYALALGNDHSTNVNSSVLEKLYGKQYFYHVWKKQLSDWNHTLRLDELIKLNKPLYLYADENYIRELKPPFALKMISKGKYLIDSDKYKPLRPER